MANPTVRMASVYIADKKALTVNKASVKFLPARTPVFGQEGYLSSSKGAVQFEITVTEVTPVLGSSLGDIQKKVLNQEDIDCGVIIAGKLCRASMACTAFEFESESENGTCTGTATFHGGVPSVEG